MELEKKQEKQIIQLKAKKSIERHEGEDYLIPTFSYVRILTHLPAK